MLKSSELHRNIQMQRSQVFLLQLWRREKTRRHRKPAGRKTRMREEAAAGTWTGKPPEQGEKVKAIPIA